MGRQLKDLTFEEWLRQAFDHLLPEDGLLQAWYWDTERDWWQEDTSATIEFLTRAFEDAAWLLIRGACCR